MDANQSVARALKILEHLAAAGAPQGVRDVARALGVSPSIAQRLLATLAEHGFADPRGTFDVLWSTGAARALAALGDPEGIEDGLAEIAAYGRTLSGVDYLTAAGERDQLAIRMGRFHEEWDLLLTPAVPIPAFEAGREIPPGGEDPRWPGWTPFTYPFNLTQQPAATVPCGFTAAGLPAGLQIVGPRHADALVLRAARAYEAAHPHRTVARTDTP